VFRDAAVRLGGRTVWSRVSFEVHTGEFVAVLGPNGVGKSTLVKAVLGILPLSEGDVTVLGLGPGVSGREIGYLPQRRSFDPNIRIRGIDVVRLGSDGDRWGLPLPGGSALSAGGRARRQRVAEVIELVGATSYAHRPIGQISGGEQQRLLIAQALVRRPRMLLLDEPLDSLDLPNQASVAALISEISQEFGITVLIVAHDVNPIVSYLDGVVYVARGGAVCGPPDQVITSETLSSLYGTPIEVLRTSDGQMVVVGSPEAPAHHADRHAGHTH
jgi:zinc/manganese transport system ATP-binding protein